MHGDRRLFWCEIINSRISTRILASGLKIFGVSYTNEGKGAYDMICLLNAIGLSPGGSSTVRI